MIYTILYIHIIGKVINLIAWKAEILVMFGVKPFTPELRQIAKREVLSVVVASCRLVNGWSMDSFAETHCQKCSSDIWWVQVHTYRMIHTYIIIYIITIILYQDISGWFFNMKLRQKQPRGCRWKWQSSTSGLEPSSSLRSQWPSLGNVTQMWQSQSEQTSSLYTRLFQKWMVYDGICMSFCIYIYTYILIYTIYKYNHVYIINYIMYIIYIYTANAWALPGTATTTGNASPSSSNPYWRSSMNVEV